MNENETNSDASPKKAQRKGKLIRIRNINLGNNQIFVLYFQKNTNSTVIYNLNSIFDIGDHVFRLLQSIHAQDKYEHCDCVHGQQYGLARDCGERGRISYEWTHQ